MNSFCISRTLDIWSAKPVLTWSQEFMSTPLFWINLVKSRGHHWKLLSTWFGIMQKFPDSIPCWFLLPTKDLRYRVMRFYGCAVKLKRIILSLDSWFQNYIGSASDSTWFLEPSTWFRIMSGPLGIVQYNLNATM